MAVVLALGGIVGLLPTVADASQAASMGVRLTPERLGAATAVSLDFQIAPERSVPVGLSAVELAYPADLGFGTSGLGVAACSQEDLEVVGAAACPANSAIGSGRATVALAMGPLMVREDVSLTLFAAPSTDGYLHVLLYASGTHPVYAQVVFSGVLLPGRLSIVVPPIPSLPAAPDIALVKMHLTLGGRLTYYERLRGRTVAYHPPGVGLPNRCPRRGFAFAVSFVFLDGSRSDAHTAVPCPRRARGARH